MVLTSQPQSTAAHRDCPGMQPPKPAIVKASFQAKEREQLGVEARREITARADHYSRGFRLMALKQIKALAVRSNTFTLEGRPGDVSRITCRGRVCRSLIQIRRPAATIKVGDAGWEPMLD